MGYEERRVTDFKAQKMVEKAVPKMILGSFEDGRGEDPEEDQDGGRPMRWAKTALTGFLDPVGCGELRRGFQGWSKRGCRSRSRTGS